MNNYFLTEYNNALKSRSIEENEKEAFVSIVENLFKKNLRGWQKIYEIDGYDGESAMGDTVIFPGTVYAFQYQAKQPSVYESGNVKFEWYDSFPIVLVTENINDTLISGINLNLCSPPVRAQIINLLYNIDENFYIKSGAEKMAINGKKPLSEEVMKTFMNPASKKEFLDMVVKTCNLKYAGFISRYYNIQNIKNPRLIETWQYKYLPFLRYTGDLKDEVLKLIWSISGMKEEL